MPKTRTRVRFGAKQKLIRNRLENVTGREGYTDLELDPGFLANSEEDGTPTVYTGRRISEESQVNPSTVADHFTTGIIPSHNMMVGKQVIKVAPAKTVQEYITKAGRGRSLLEDDALTSETDLAKQLDVPQGTLWSMSKRLELPTTKLGKNKYYGSREAGLLGRQVALINTIQEDWATPEDLAQAMGVTLRTVYNWLERDFACDADSGKKLPSTIPAVLVEDSPGTPESAQAEGAERPLQTHHRYLLPRELVEGKKVIAEWKSRFPREYKRKALPEQMREWTPLAELAKQLKVKPQTMVTYAAAKELGAVVGNERLVSEWDALHLWKHYFGTRFARRYCLSIERFAETVGVNPNTFRWWVTNHAEKDDRGPKSIFGLPFFRFEGRVYLPKRSPKAGYEVYTSKGRADLYRRLQKESDVAGHSPEEIENPQAEVGKLIAKYGTIQDIAKNRQARRALRRLGFDLDVKEPPHGSTLGRSYKITPLD